MVAAAVWALAALASLPAPGKRPDAPERSWVIEGMTEQTVLDALPAEGAPASVEGLWQATPGGAKVAVVPGDAPGGRRTLAQGWLMVIVDSPRASVRPGTVTGWMEAAAERGVFSGWAFTRCQGDTLTAPRRFRFELDGGNHLKMTEIRSGLKFTPWRMLPFLYRRGLSERQPNDQGLGGFLRLAPLVGPPLQPRRL